MKGVTVRSATRSPHPGIGPALSPPAKEGLQVHLRKLLSITVGAIVAMSLSVAVAPAANAAPGISGSYNTVASQRLLDTRSGLGAPQHPVPRKGTLTFNATAGITGPVSAVVLNVTAVNPAAVGYLTVYPAGGVRPLASNLNYQPRQTVPNMVVVKTGPGGQVSIFNGSEGTIDVLADIEGYFAGGGTPTEAGTMVSTEPTRLLDTRIGTGGPKMKIPAYTQTAVPIAGLKGIPADASAVALNLTAVTPAARGYLTAYPGTPTPMASTLNFEVPQTRANLTLVQINQGGAETGAPKGTVTIYNGSAKPIDVVADVDGYFLAGTPAVDGSFVTSTPFRVLDTRNPGGRPLPALSTAKVFLFPPNDPTFFIFKAVQVNVVAAGPTAAGFLTTWDGSIPQPSVSSSNFVRNANVAGSVIVPVNADGSISIYNGSYGTVDLVVDVNGFFLNDLTNLPAAGRGKKVADALTKLRTLSTRSTPKSITKATR